MIEVKIKLLRENAKVPVKSSENAAGWDVFVSEIVIDPNDPDLVTCKLGFALAPDPHYRIMLVPRSSFTKSNYVMQNSPGLGDPDYRGEYMMKFRKIKDTESNQVPFLVGDRVGQIYVEKIIPMGFTKVEELNETKRSSGGFGSTGK